MRRVAQKGGRDWWPRDELGSEERVAWTRESQPVRAAFKALYCRLLAKSTSPPSSGNYVHEVIGLCAV